MNSVQASRGSVDLTRELIYDLEHNQALKTKPYPYQSRVLAETLANLTRDGYHGLLLDMGTGKTLVTLYTYLQLLRCGMVDHMVVVAPKTLLSTWLEQLNEHVDVTVTPIGVTTWRPSASNRYLQELVDFTSSPRRVFLVNVEAFQTKNVQLESFLGRVLTTRRVLMVCDESSKIKSPQAARTKRLLNLSREARFRLILTGTEVTKDCLDLYTQFKFLDENFWKGLPGFFAFRCRYAVLQTEYGTGGRTFQKVVGYQRQDELLGRLAPHVSRIKKEDVLDLPPKRYQDVWLEMPAKLREVYEELKNELMVEYAGQELTVANMAVLFGRFRQLVGGHFPRTDGEPPDTFDPALNLKLRYLLDELEDTHDKVIVWACYQDEIKLIHQCVPDSVMLYGDLVIAERTEEVRRFRDDPAVRVLVASPAVAAYGLNLQHCHLVYWYSNPTAAEMRWQGEDRCHRIGQVNSVLYKDLLYKDSVDVRVKELLAGKTSTREFFRNGMTVKDFLGAI